MAEPEVEGRNRANWRENVAPPDPMSEPQPPKLPRRQKVYGRTQAGSMEDAIVRSNRALELRMAGATWQQVADTLAYRSVKTAQTAVRTALEREQRRVGDVREEYRTMQLLRTERSMRAIWPQVISGDLFAVDRMIKIMERQAKLLGLDAPTQVSITDDTKQALLTTLSDLEKFLIPGEVVPDEPNGSRRAGDSDQVQTAVGGDGRAGSGDAGRGTAGATAEVPALGVGALPLAGTTAEHPDHGDVDAVGGPGDRQD
jgi:hypothetical protein